MTQTKQRMKQVEGAGSRHQRRPLTRALLPAVLPICSALPTPNLQGRSALGATGHRKALRGPGGSQAPADSRDVDFVAHLLVVKNHSKLKLSVCFLKLSLMAMCIHHREQVTNILPKEIILILVLILKRTKLKLQRLKTCICLLPTIL